MATMALLRRSWLMEAPISDLPMTSKLIAGQGLVQDPDQVVGDLAHGLFGLLQLDDEFLAAFHRLDLGVAPAFFVQGAAHLVDGEGLGGAHLHQGAAAELHPQVAVAPAELDKADDPQEAEDPGNGEGIMAPADEVDVGFCQKARRS